MVNQNVKFVVRRALPTDIENMLAVWQETAELLVSADRRYRLAADAPIRWQNAVNDWLTQDDMAIFLAERKGKVTGYIIGAITANLPGFLPDYYGYVHDLAMDSHGLAGAGQSLLTALQGWFRDKGITELQARVPTRHPVAQAFWRALGATELYNQMIIRIERP